MIWLMSHTGPFLPLSMFYGYEWHHLPIAVGLCLGLTVLCLGPIALHFYQPGRWPRFWVFVGVAVWFLAGWFPILNAAS